MPFVGETDWGGKFVFVKLLSELLSELERWFVFGPSLETMLKIFEIAIFFAWFFLNAELSFQTSTQSSICIFSNENLQLFVCNPYLWNAHSFIGRLDVFVLTYVVK